MFQYEAGKDSHCEYEAWFLWHESSWAILVNSQQYLPDNSRWRTTELIFLLEDCIRSTTTFCEDIGIWELAYSVFTGQLQGKLSPFSSKPFRGNA